MEGSAPLDPAAAGPPGTGSTPAPAVATARASMRARRPAIVTILAILQLLTAAAYGMILAALIVGPDTLAGPIGDVLLGEVETATFALVVGGFAVATLAAGILLLRMRQLGWTITMLLSGLGLVSSIAVWWTQATTTPILLFVQVASVFYLNQRQVREAFGISRREAGDAPSDAGATRDSAGAAPAEARG